MLTQSITYVIILPIAPHGANRESKVQNVYSLASNKIGHLGLKAAEDAYQEGLDEDDRRERVLGATETELRVTLAAAFTGSLDAVPSYRMHGPFNQCVETQVSAADAVVEVIAGDSKEVVDALMQALVFCTCPTVQALRVAIAARYAKDKAESIASARGLL